MAMTLAQADVLSLPEAKKGVIETIIEEGGGVIDRLPWEFLVGTNLTYVREYSLPTVDFYDVNEDIAESTGEDVQVTATLRKMLGQSYLDNMLRRTKGNIANIEAEYVRKAVKAATRKFLSKFIYGNTATNTKEFSGLHKLVDSNMIVSMGTSATGAALSLYKLDELIDKIKPGKPDILLCNKTVRRRMAQAARTASVSGLYQPGIDAFGRRVEFYDGIPLIPSDFITQLEAISSNTYTFTGAGVTTSIFAIKFGDVTSGGLMGIQGSDVAEITRKVAEKKDSTIFQVAWYCALALGNIYSLGQLDGITDAAVTA